MAQRPRLDRARETTLAESVRYFKRHRRKLKVHVHEGPMESVRTETHRGHEIEIAATYDIRIDGRRLGGHLMVGNDGRVHYHGLPNYTWGSMVDMCKQLIESFPEQFPAKGRPPPRAVPLRGESAKAAAGKAARKKPAKKKAAKKKTAKKRASSRAARKAKGA